MKSEFYTITNKLNIYIENKCIKSSAEIIEDITFAQSLNGLIVLGTIKGNVRIYHSENLDLLAKHNVSASKISCIHAELRETKA